MKREGLALRLTTVTRWLLPALLLAMAGCGAAPVATARPTVRILAPANGLKETGPANVTVRLSISNFTLLFPGASGTTGSGQVNLYENGKLLAQMATTSYPLVLRPGTYTLKAVLVTNGKTVAASAPTVVSVLPAPTQAPTQAPPPKPISCAHAPQPSTGLKTGTISLFCNGLPTGSLVNTLVPGPGGDLWFPVSPLGGTGTSGIGRIAPSGAITVFSHGLPAGVFVGNLVTGPGGNLWFTVGTSGIGRITPSGVITVFSQGLPAHSYPSGLVVGPGGDLWFTVSPGNGGTSGIGRITPSGVITVFSHGLPAGSYPGGLVVGPGANLWFTVRPLSGTSGIGRITPAGVITVFSHGLPAGSLNLPPGTQHADPLVVGPDGNLWFTVSPSSGGGTTGIGRITPSGAVTVFNSQRAADGHFLGHLVAGSDGNLWFTADKGIGRITPSGVITVFSQGLPAGGGAFDLVAGSGGNLWFADNAAAGGTTGIGRITPSGAITVFSHGLPSGGGASSLMTGPAGNLWFTTGNEIGRITASGAITVFTSQSLAAAGGAGSLVTGPDGALWFVVPPSSGCCPQVTLAIGRIVP